MVNTKLLPCRSFAVPFTRRSTMSNQSLILVMTVIFAIASNMDYEDAEMLRASNRQNTSEASVAPVNTPPAHRA